MSYSSDSPGAGRRHLAKKNSVVEGLIDPERDIYAIPSQVLIMIWRLCSNKFSGSGWVQQPWNLLPLHHWHPHTLRSQKDDRKSRQDSQVWLQCWRNKVNWLPWPVLPLNLTLWNDDFQHCWTRSVWEEVPLISKRGGHRVNLFI